MAASGANLMWRSILFAAVLAPLPVQAQSLDSARAFTQALYAAYGTRDPEHLGRDAERTFSPALLALIRRDRDTAPPGEVGILDGDPICDCQDFEGIKLMSLTLAEKGPGKARADVTLRFPDETRSLSLDLVAAEGAWRVDDVHSDYTPSLVKLLEDGLRDRKP
jgi:hypothetical protein